MANITFQSSNLQCADHFHIQLEKHIAIQFWLQDPVIKYIKKLHINYLNILKMLGSYRLPSEFGYYVSKKS